MTRSPCTVVLAASALLVGCGGDERPVVLVASSLRPALEAARQDVRVSFGASGVLAAQIRHGADADVIVAADPRILAELVEERLVDAPVTIARNGLAVLVRRGNPLAIASLADLAPAGRRVAVAARGVPLGDYTQQALVRAGLESIGRNVVTEEPDAGSVLTAVARGEVDAGIGYSSDLATERVDGFVLPSDLQAGVRYDVAVVRGGRRARATRSYVRWLTGAGGRGALAAAGFTAP